mgnify:CR=1 FL=1|jgi:hypothetical protein
MSLDIRWPDNFDDLPQAEQDFIQHPQGALQGLPLLMMHCGVGQIPSTAHKWGGMPKSFVTADFLKRMQVFTTLFDSFRLPSFVTVEWLDSVNTITANVSFVTTRSWKGLCYTWLDYKAERKYDGGED